MTLEGIDNVHGGDGLPLGVLGISYGVTDDILEEHLEDTTGLFVDEARDTLDTSSTGKTTDCRLGDALDVISQDLTVPLGASLSEPLAALSTSSHDALVLQSECWRRHYRGRLYSEMAGVRGRPRLLSGCMVLFMVLEMVFNDCLFVF